MVTTENMTDGNASFLRAARSGNLEKVLEFLKGNVDINTSNANGLNALHLAAKEGHVGVVTELLKKGANVNAATKKGNTALHIASLAGQEEVVRVLVQLGANVNVQSQNGFTPLYMAAQENHDHVVSFLLANGANQSLATEDGFTPLAVALQQGHDKVVAVLLENDTKGRVRLPALHIAAKKDDCKAATLLLQSDHNPDVTSKSGFTPLHIAAHYGNENIAQILLRKGADVNYAAKHQITPLHVASKWGKLNMVTLLLEHGANIDASTRDGLTPLHCAARSGHDQVVDFLLEKGAPILAKTKNGLAPLHMASQGDHVDSARILLYHKAPVDDVTVDYLTALHVAAHCGHVKVAKLLLDRKADANARALNGFTPLHIACKKNRIKVVELLLKHGASIEATTESGLTPLHVASFMGCMNIVIYLIQNGSNPDVPTVRGETPLHLAARANQTDIIRILLRNGASVDARAREDQTPLHIAARLGNVDIVSLLLQHGAAVDATTKDLYTALHIAAKEDQEEVALTLLDHGASLTATTKKGFTPLHLAAKYGNIKVARLLLQKGAPVDAQGKNGVTPLHVAAHYDHVNVALLLLDEGASPHATAKNGYTPLHIAAKKNQVDITTTLLDHGAKADAESKAGFTPLHLASQEGHSDIACLLIGRKADVNHKANNGLTPLHLCAQDDRVNVATILVRNGAEVGPQTKAGYTPLHVASHFGQVNMVRFLLQHDADVRTVTSHGYTPLHQAAQQGHTLVVNLLLEHQASPNVTTTQGQTPLSIAQRLGYISVVETLKVVTETTVTTTTTTVTEEKYKVVAPETMQETFMTDSEDEGGEEAMLGDQSYRYLTADEMKSLGDDSLPIDVTKDEKQIEAVQAIKQYGAPMVEEDNISPQHMTPVESGFSSEKFSPDNIDLARAPVHAGSFSWDDDYYYSFPPNGMLRSSRLKWKTFLVSFMVDARGGAMRGCRHSGVRVIIPPRKASMPMRITCRYLRKEKLVHPPPLMEGEACASRILEMGPVGARFLGPVIIEVPHFASSRGKEREITILRSDNGESWREHTLEASEEAVQDVLNESFEGEELSALEDLNTNRITRILTTDFPQYFAIVTRVRQEVHGVGPEGGMVSSTVVPQVQAVFPEGALTKKIRVGLQAQPIAPELVAKLLGNRVAVSPIVTVEPRRRKFHKPITLTIPVPQAATKGMINQYSGDAPTLRLLCSITGGSSKAQWEDVTGSTPLTFVNDCVSFTTTVSARFWLMDCRQVNEVTRFATELYQEAVYVPFMAKFVIFAKKHDPCEAQLRVFCMTDDKEDKTLEMQERFTEVAKSRDVEVLEGKMQYLEFAGNFVPVTKSGEQLKFTFQAFHENRLPFTIRVKDPHAEPMGRIAFMKEPRVGRGEPPQTPICNLNVALPEVTLGDSTGDVLELVTLEKKYDFIQEAGLSKPELIHRADLRLSDIARELEKDWIALARQLDLSEADIERVEAEASTDPEDQALVMLRLWLQRSGPRATGNELEKALRKISREDIIKNCMFNVELVTDDVEKAVAKVHLDQSGFDVFKEELGSSREASMRRGASLDISYDEQDIMKEAESAAETSSETGSLFERDQISQAFADDKEIAPDLVCRTHPSKAEIILPNGDSIARNAVDDDDENFVDVPACLQNNDDLFYVKETFESFSPDIPYHAPFEETQKPEISKNDIPENNQPNARDSINLQDILDLENEPIMIKENVHDKNLQNSDQFVFATPEQTMPNDIICTSTSGKNPCYESSEIVFTEHVSHIPESNEQETLIFEPVDSINEVPECEYKKVHDFWPPVLTVQSHQESTDLSDTSDDIIEEAQLVYDAKNVNGGEPELGMVEPKPPVEMPIDIIEDVQLEYDYKNESPVPEIIQNVNGGEEEVPLPDISEEGMVEPLPTNISLITVDKTSSDLQVSDQPDLMSSLVSDESGIFEASNGVNHTDNSEQDAKIRRPSKTPPPSPAEVTDKQEDDKIREILIEKPLQEIKEIISKKSIENEIKSNEGTSGVVTDGPEVPAKFTESETWPSFDMDTSQVSISSLPEDEKSEPAIAVPAVYKDVTEDITEKTEVDDSGTTTHIIQKTTYMTITTRQVSGEDGEAEGDAASDMQQPRTPSPDSPELSFAEKRDFFQKLSQSSSSPSGTPAHTVKSQREVKPDTVVEDKPISATVDTERTPEEPMSFEDRLKFFQKSSEPTVTRTEVKEVVKEVWTVVEELKPTDHDEQEREVSMEEVVSEQITKEVSPPLYESKEVSETDLDSSRETKVEVLVTKMVPGHEVVEICSVEDVTSSKAVQEPEDQKICEETFVKTSVSSTEAASRAAFKKETLDNKWQRESPDNISIVKEAMEPSLGKSEIFICTGETLDSVKKILSMADAESNVVLPDVGSAAEGSPDKQKEMFICTDETADSVKKIMSLADQESNVFLPESQAKEMFICTDETTEHVKEIMSAADAESYILKQDRIEEEIVKVDRYTTSAAPKTTVLEESKSEEIEDVEESSSKSVKSESIRDRSIDIEILPVLEVSEDVIKESVDKTGHEALGTPCSFHKEMSVESKHSDLEQIFAQQQQEIEKEATQAALEKADYEDVEKDKMEKVMYKDSTGGKERVHSVEVTQYTQYTTEVYNVPSEKLMEKFSSKKIQIEDEKDARPAPRAHKFNQFLDSVTQMEDSGSSFALPSDLAATVDKRTEEWIDQSGELLLNEGGIKDYLNEGTDNGMMMYEDRHPTLEDEQHKRSSPTAESFDDKARVEQCDTDVMMQLLDFVSRNEIEMSEVRTEDEAPDIEEDVSPSAEEEICTEHDEKSQDLLKTTTTDSDRLLPSPLRSSFDSVTSPSRKDAPSENLETVVEQKLQKAALLRETRPQSSLEVEVGSHDGDDMLCHEVEKEVIHLGLVAEEDPSKRSSTENLVLETEIVQVQEPEKVQESVIVKESVQEKQASPLDDVFEPEIEPVPQGKSFDQPSVVIKEQPEEEDTKEKLPESPIPAQGTPETQVKAKLQEERSLETEESISIEEAEQGFAPCAFINTAFAGAELIDEVEKSSSHRSRSPYEVVREDQSVKSSLASLRSLSDDMSDDDVSSSSGKVVHVVRYIDKRRPILEHIPSEISEEDLVEREIMSPDVKEAPESAKDLGSSQAPEEEPISKSGHLSLHAEDIISKTDDVTTPESDTGLATSPFEYQSEEEPKSGTYRIQSLPKSEVDEKSQDSVIMTTTTSQSYTDKTISASLHEASESVTLADDRPKHGDISEMITKHHKMNGPGEVDYNPEYDDEFLLADGDDAKKIRYSSISDDTVDSEIGEILKSDAQPDDIIERPVTPEPPKDDEPDRRLEIPELQITNEYAYGMHFEKEDQPDEAMDLDSDHFSEEKDLPYAYGMRFERETELEEDDIPCYGGDLYTHEEEDEDALMESGEKAKPVPKPDFDILAGRKCFSKNVESDEQSVSSLQEFERLEEEIVSGRKSSIGSVDSLNGRHATSKSGDHDDVSMSSLTEFERLERECLDTDKIEPAMQESITQLSEIEEGHESQASEASQDKSEAGKEEEESDRGFEKIEDIPFNYMLQHQDPTLRAKDDDIDQDSLHEDLSVKPDSLTEDDRHDYHDSLRDEKLDDLDSLQGEIPDDLRDSLIEERLIEDDSLREMDILPDESSLSLESSLAASSKAEDQGKMRGLEMEVKLPQASHSGKVEVMASSTDSLEQSSFAAQSAFHVESALSSSLSALTSEDYTMVSGSDTLEQEGRITYRYEDIPVDELESLVKDGRKIIVDSEGNIQDFRQFRDTELISTSGKIEVNIPETVHTVHHAVTTVTYPDFEEQSTEEDPEVEIEEIHTTDEHGNPKTIKRIKRTIRTTTQRFTSSSSPKDVEEQMKEFLRDHTASGGEEEIKEERTIDETGNVVLVRTVKQQMVSDPEVHSRTFTGPDAESRSSEFVQSFRGVDPTDDVTEYEKMDEQGNVVRVTHQVVMKPEVRTVTFSGPDAHRQMEEFMKQSSSTQEHSSAAGAHPTDEVTEVITEDGTTIRTVTSSYMSEPMEDRVVMRTTTTTSSSVRVSEVEEDPTEHPHSSSSTKQ